MSNTEITTLQVDRDNYTEQQWEWLINNWNKMHRMGKKILDKQFEEYDGEFPSDIRTSVFIELSVGMFNSKEDYLEFKNIDHQVIENEIIDWFYFRQTEKYHNQSVSKSEEEE